MSTPFHEINLEREIQIHSVCKECNRTLESTKINVGTYYIKEIIIYVLCNNRQNVIDVTINYMF
jgi:hypothetical protein